MATTQCIRLMPRSTVSAADDGWEPIDVGGWSEVQSLIRVFGGCPRRPSEGHLQQPGWIPAPDALREALCESSESSCLQSRVAHTPWWRIEAVARAPPAAPPEPATDP